MPIPTKYRPEYCDEVIALGKEGKTRCEYAAAFNVAPKSLRDWAKSHEEFAEAIELALTYAQAWWEAIGRESLGVKTFKDQLWAKNMASRFRADWSEKSTVTLAGDPSNPVKHTVEYVIAGKNNTPGGSSGS